MEFNLINNKNRNFIIVIALIIITTLMLYSNFRIHVYDSQRKIFTILTIAGLYWISSLIFKSIKEFIPDSFYENKWHEALRLIPILVFLLLLFINSLTCDSIRDYHLANYKQTTTGEMIDQKYYFFKINGETQYGQISYEKLSKQKGDKITIDYSDRNPIINKPIE